MSETPTPTRVPASHHAVYVDGKLVATFLAPPRIDGMGNHRHPVRISVTAPMDQDLFLADVYDREAKIGGWNENGEWGVPEPLTVRPLDPAKANV